MSVDVCFFCFFFFFLSKEKEEKPAQPSGLSREESNTFEYGKVASQLGRRSCWERKGSFKAQDLRSSVQFLVALILLQAVVIAHSEPQLVHV